MHGRWRRECTADGGGSARQMEEGVHGRWRRECTADGGGSARQTEEGVHGRWRGSARHYYNDGHSRRLVSGEPKTLTKSTED